MPPNRKKAQPRLEVQKYKLLRQPMNLIGTQVKFLGSFWEGRMTAEEKATEYLCTVLDFQIAHRMQPGAPPTQAFSAAGDGHRRHRIAGEQERSRSPLALS